MATAYKWRALSVTSLGSLLSILDGTIFIIALPSIMKGLDADLLTITWIIMGYMLIMTLLVPTFGRIADMVGRKKLYIGGFILFTVSSLFCGTAVSGFQLLIFRMIQAIGGSLLVANSAAIVTDAFPKEELGTAMGINSMIFGVGAAIGPVLGGLLLQFGWRFIFFINIPTGAIGTIWGAVQLKELVKFPKKRKFDWIGTVLFTIGISGLLVGLSFGGFVGWFSPMIIVVIPVGAVCFFLFAEVERRAEFPMMDLRLFKASRLAYGFGAALLNAIARGAVIFLLTFFLQIILELDPITAAIYLTPFAVALTIGAPVSGRLADRYGTRELSTIGLLISAIGLLGMMFVSIDTSFLELVLWMSLMGLGSGLFFSPNAKVIMEAVPPLKRGIATGVRSMLFNAGQVVSLGLALAILSEAISLNALTNLFLGLQVGSEGVEIAEFIIGIRFVFTISFAATLLAAFISSRKGVPPQWENNAEAIPKGEAANVPAGEHSL
ncbi:MAG: MFS transporter [Candidatus Thorarchaeota archaeon]|nr:MAG: MFS transporter [Candidatus Thorarchaeota archaeon]